MGGQIEHKLMHREKDGKKDTYVLGRSRNIDIVVNNPRVSSKHCLIYCDYTEARLRVFIEDSSVNGTFINDSLMKLSRGERLELKSGDEIFLVNPRNLDMHSPENAALAFMFINLRDRLVVKREATMAPTVSTNRATAATANNSLAIPINGINGINGTNDSSGSGSSLPSAVPLAVPPVVRRHVEDFYIIGEQIGSGMCGQVHICRDRFSGEYCAVKIIDTKKFALSPGLSSSELRQEAEMMRSLSHVRR
jgi:pSer/pThr/pTyr-binding forkhead associated (FHA) protein